MRANSSIRVASGYRASILSWTAIGLAECSVVGASTVFWIDSSAIGKGLPFFTVEQASTNSQVGLTIDGRTPLAPIGLPSLVVLTHTKATPL